MAKAGIRAHVFHGIGSTYMFAELHPTKIACFAIRIYLAVLLWLACD
jgi:hypothetical protein